MGLDHSIATMHSRLDPKTEDGESFYKALPSLLLRFCVKINPLIKQSEIPYIKLHLIASKLMFPYPKSHITYHNFSHFSHISQLISSHTSILNKRSQK